MSEYEEDDFYTQRKGGAGDEYHVPDAIKTFITKLQKMILEKNVYELQSLYEEYDEVTERFYKTSPWPHSSVISPLVDDDETFVVLYKELYFRHIYAKLSPSVEDRIGSFENYIALFNILNNLDNESPAIELPDTWLWDIVDEFVYQFESFHGFRSRVKALEEDEISLLRDNPKAWSPQSIFSQLSSLVSKASLSLSPEDNIIVEGKEGEREEESDVNGFIVLLANFACVSLLRLNCLTGDYTSALRSLSPIPIGTKRNMCTHVTACYSTLNYYLSLSFLMLHRHRDALKTASSFLLFISRNKYQIPTNYQQSSVHKKIDQMYAIIALCSTFSNDRLDDALSSNMKEKFENKLDGLYDGEEASYEEFFHLACPKFVNVCIPNYEDKTNKHKETTQIQFSLFLAEIKQRSRIRDVTSCLKMCTAVSISKLSSFLDIDEDACVTSLLNLKNKSSTLRWRRGPVSLGESFSSASVDFYVTGETVNIVEYRAPRKYGEYYMRNILRLEDIIQDLQTAGQ